MATRLKKKGLLKLGPQYTPKISAYIYIYIDVRRCYVLISLKILCQTQRSFGDKLDDMKDIVSYVKVIVDVMHIST